MRFLAVPNPLRAPAQHGDLLLYPPGSLTQLVRANEARLSRSSVASRNETRAEVLALATRWTGELLGQTNVAPHPEFWIIGGHQPELFHPGVWVKNAVIASLASQLGGVGLNLIVDNDICSSSSVRVPRSPDSPGITTLDWETSKPQSPWEERHSPEAETFATFGQRCRQHLHSWRIEPLAASQDWGASPERGIVDQLVQLRGQFERSVGFQNLELKVSDLADTQGFRRFLFRSLSDADALRTAYNAALADFRSLNQIRSRSHPVPQLDATTAGIEAPFWVWRAGENRRSRLFVQQVEPNSLRLHNGQREIGRLSANSESTAIDQLTELRRHGWKIRPRALTLTLFCRVDLGSVFVHGIGGAKYDEMTDTLMGSWLGLTPPNIIVATATQRLFERFAGAPPGPEIRRLQDELRQIRWNPERVSAESSSGTPVAALQAEKKQLLTSNMSPQSRHTLIQEINTSLRSGLAGHEQRIRHALQLRMASLPDQHFLRSREFAANLFPAEAIQELFREARQQVIKPL